MKFKLFQFSGIITYLSLSWIIFFVIISVIQAVLFQNYFTFPSICLIFTFVILHEYGHALAAQRIFNLSVQDITLYPIGGIASIAFNPLDSKQELIVTLAGPLVNFAIAIVSLPFLFIPLPPFIALFFLLVFAFNVILFVFNIIPVFPMDGGRILRALLNFYLKDIYKSTLIAARIGQFICIPLSIFLFMYGSWIAPIIFLFIFLEAEKELNRIKSGLAGFYAVLCAIADYTNTPELKGVHHPNLLLEAINKIGDTEEDNTFRKKYITDSVVSLCEKIESANCINNAEIGPIENKSAN